MRKASADADVVLAHVVVYAIHYAFCTELRNVLCTLSVDRVLRGCSATTFA